MQIDAQEIGGLAIIAFIVVTIWEIVKSIFTKIIAEKVITHFNKRNDFSGTWEDQIFDSNGVVEKKDKFLIVQNGIELSGTIERLFPADQNYRRWKFKGNIQDDSIIACFWPTNKTDASFGCLFVKKQSDGHFVGYYLSRQYLSRAITDQNALQPTRIDLRKIS